MFITDVFKDFAELKLHTPPRRPDDRKYSPDESDESFKARKQCVAQENEDRNRIRNKSVEVANELAGRHWALMYSNHLVNRLTQTDIMRIEFSSNPTGNPDNPTQESESQRNLRKSDEFYSVEQRLKVLEVRRQDAQIGKKDAEETVTKLTSILCSGIQGPPEFHEIAFRVIHPESVSPFFPDGGDIRCGNWFKFKINQPLLKNDAEDHITGKWGQKTNYISISTSPLRSWDFTNSVLFRGKRGDLKVAVIDLRVLQRLGIAYGSTTEDLKIATHNSHQDVGTKYATKHHVLVLGWLPSRSIKGFLSIARFEELLGESSIATTSNRIEEYDKKISFSTMQDYLSAI